MFYSTLKNAPAYYSAGVVAVNSKVVGLAPGEGKNILFRFSLSETFFRRFFHLSICALL
jgi:hypothetical protein